MNEEKELLFIVAEQIEQIKNLKSAFLAVRLILALERNHSMNELNDKIFTFGFCD
jgi:hypothetical protein